MNCAETEALLTEVTEHRLDAPAEIGFHAHIEGCAACRERAALWRGLVPGMRALAPAPPDAMQARRMMIEIERRRTPQAGPVGARAAVSRRRWWGAFGLGLAGAAAALALWMRPPVGTQVPGAAFAAVTAVSGAVTSGGHAVDTATRLEDGSPLALASAAEAELAIGRGSMVRVWGPAQMMIGGSPRAVALRLDEGRLEARVEHRRPDETFAVVTRHMRVEVRGTRFSVGVEASGSSLRVDEGRVEVRLAGGESRLVSAGETFRTAAPEPPPAEAPVAADPTAPVAAVAPASEACATVTRSCEATARTARETMRGGNYDRALRLVAAAGRETHRGSPACPDATDACAGELGYLRAEALRGSGRLGDAIVAYKELDSRGAPATMRQNALYAAAQLEQRQGNVRAAQADYERALAAAPRGALREEALLGSMESSAAAGDGARAAALARRYLAEFPSGLGATTARRLTMSGSRP